ncbi:MAG TPA: hypothetical protein VI893_02730 [Thermoplasmata archaeon]|nr:hypothetical protein [Thermoplasmata archaeon]
MDGGNAERPPVEIADIVEIIETVPGPRRQSPDRIRAHRWQGSRTVIVTYVENEEEIHVISVSATRRRF